MIQRLRAQHPSAASTETTLERSWREFVRDDPDILPSADFPEHILFSLCNKRGYLLSRQGHVLRASHMLIFVLPTQNYRLASWQVQWRKAPEGAVTQSRLSVVNKETTGNHFQSCGSLNQEKWGYFLTGGNEYFRGEALSLHVGLGTSSSGTVQKHSYTHITWYYKQA